FARNADFYLDVTASCLAFFFQAEDGIRDRNVTGVQTCALPISDVGILIRAPSLEGLFATAARALMDWIGSAPEGRPVSGLEMQEIGRASCRERVSWRLAGVCLSSYWRLWMSCASDCACSGGSSV